MGKRTQAAVLTISRRTLQRWLIGAAAMGVALAVVGIQDAYAQLGAGSPGGRVVTVAIVVATLSVASALLITRRMTR